MKILHIITSLRTGGAERLLVDLLPRFAAKGAEVDLLLFDSTRTAFFDELEANGIRIFSLGNGYRSMRNPFHLFRLGRFLKHYDIVHTHNTSCQLLTAAASVFCRPRARLVTTEHLSTNRRRVWRGFKWVDELMYSRYERIICVSDAVQKSLAAWLDRESLQAKLQTIPNGIDLEKFRDAKADAKLQEQYRGRHIVLMVSAFRAQKDQPTLIRAMKRLSEDFVLLLAGEGECIGESKRLVRDLGLENRVLFLGDRKDIPALLSLAEVVVMSSFYEGLSLSSIEAMASGRPFVASDVAGLHEAVQGAGLLFPQGDDARLAELILRLSEDKTLCADVVSRCQERASLYDISRMANDYMRVYETLAQ